MSGPSRYGAGDHEMTHRDAQAASEPRGWKPFQPSQTGPEARVKSDYGYGRLDRSSTQPIQPMREERSFWSRTSDEVRSWFGDRHAEERRTADLARAHGFEAVDPHDDENDVVWHGKSNLPPPK